MELAGRIITVLLVVVVLVSTAALARLLWDVDLGPLNGLLDAIARVVPSTNR